jgi:hypothetical protein
VFLDCLQHADLHGAETPASGQNERRRHEPPADQRY